MTDQERSTIQDLGKCNFKAVHEYFKMKAEERRARSKEEKQVCVRPVSRLCILAPLIGRFATGFRKAESEVAAITDKIVSVPKVSHL